MNIAVLSYSTENLGDEIQSLATQSYLEALGCQEVFYLDRDSHQFSGPQKTPCLLIANGWYSHGRLPFPPFIQPVFLSVHIEYPWIENNTDALVYLKAHEPIGCRDRMTAQILDHFGIRTYLSYCLTLGLKNDRDSSQPRREHYGVDLTRKGMDRLRSLYPTAKACSHFVEPNQFSKVQKKRIAQRQALAQEQLELYKSAQSVTTSRLHCFLPCIALGTPVIFEPHSPYSDLSVTESRFSGYHSLLKIKPGAHKFPPFPPLSKIERLHRAIIGLSIREGHNIMQAVENLDTLDDILAKLDALG